MLLQISLFLQTNSTLWHQVRFSQVDINSKMQFLPNFFFARSILPCTRILWTRLLLTVPHPWICTLMSWPQLFKSWMALSPDTVNHYPTNKGNQLRFPLDSVIHLLNNWGQGFPFREGRAVKKFLSSRLIMNSRRLWN